MGTNKFSGLGVIIILLLAAAAVFVWSDIFFERNVAKAELYFLDVGQGDAELAIFPPNVKVLIDAGPDRAVIEELEKVLGGDKYIDLAFISHPQLDHFNGFNYLLDKYRFGAFFFNGRNDSPAAGEWSTFLNKIGSLGIPLVTLSAGDSVKYTENGINILSPDNNFAQSGELNDTGLVEFMKTSVWSALFTADIGSNIENYLVKSGLDLEADILKVAHHGSKYSSSADFLRAVAPKLAMIGVGAGNTYKHPTPEVLSRLKNVASSVFRTDNNGLIEVLTVDSLKIQILTEK